MRWPKAVAPIRQKMLVAFGSLIGLMLLTSLIGLVRGDWIMAATGAVTAAIGTILGLKFRRSICDPYVNTVVCMEALAAGDLTGPIACTAYQDCVGRMRASLESPTWSPPSRCAPRKRPAAPANN
ncbi:hypothetical protein [Sphingomonas sp.]|uniref:hypothetical protein n=1 Tax=Sphingomonas sp. TaxID=28214 RepID=UPI003BAB6CD5